MAFWVIKLKPLNSLGLRKDGVPVECSDINERMTLRWVQMTIWTLIEQNKIPEILPRDDAIKASVNHIFDSYFNEDLFGRSADPEDPGSKKSYETGYYMRYKKMTAINIYESLVHLFLPIKVGFRQGAETVR